MKKILSTLLIILGLSPVAYLGARTAVARTSSTIITTGSATTTLRTFPTPNTTSTIIISSLIVANGVSTSTSESWNCVAGFRIINSSTISQLGNTTCDRLNNTSTYWIGYTTTTSGIKLQVSGFTSTTIKWSDYSEDYILQ